MNYDLAWSLWLYGPWPMLSDIVWTYLDCYETLRLAWTLLRPFVVIPMHWGAYAWILDYGLWPMFMDIELNHTNKP